MGALDGQWIALVVGDAIVPTGKRNRLAPQQPLDNSDRLRQPRHPGAGRIEAQPRLVVFGSHVSGAQAELKSAIGQEVDCRRLTGYQHRVAQVIVEHMRANLEACRRLGSADQRRHWRKKVCQVIGHIEHGVAEVLEFPGLLPPLGARGRAPDVHTETEGLHRMPPLLPTQYADT